jgi:hypothetical protein
METELEAELSSSQRRKILADELNAVLSKLDSSFAEVLEDVVEHLFAKAETSVNNRESQLFLDAYNNMRKKSGEIQKRFKNTFRTLLDEGIDNSRSNIGTPASLQETDWGNLSLVDTDKVEEDVQVKRLTDKIKSSVEWELRDLNARMSYLLGRDGAEEGDNPLRPEVFCRAIGKVCSELESDHQVRIELLRGFEEALSVNLNTVYQDLNKRLISYRVLPKVHHTHSAARRNVAPRKAQDGYQSDYQNELSRVTNAVENVVEGTLSIFEALQKLVGNSPAYRNSLGAANDAAGSGTRRNLMGAIRELREAQEVGFGAQSPLDLAQLPNYIWANRDQLSAAAGNQVDRMKIDIVAMLFDQILADDKLPAEFKTLLGRLQLPVLRVALADGSFFATRAHPTRRLIDRIASCAVGFESQGNSEASHRFVAEVERIVNAVLADVDEDAHLYEELLAEFELFLLNEQNHDNDIVGRAAGVLERAEAREVLGINATIQVNQLLYGVALEPALRAFLLDVWVYVLVEAACRAADNRSDPSVERYKQLCIDLVWSAQPKSSPEDRRRLVAMLPKMIGCIREGLALIGYPPDQETQFFSQLMQIHSQAVRAPNATPEENANVDRFATQLREMVVESDASAVAAESTAEAKLSGQAARRVAAESQGEVNVIEVADEPEEPLAGMLMPSDDTVSRWVESLERGNWYELKVNGEYTKVRLAWISPMRSFYLFVPSEGLHGHSLHPDALRRALRTGELRFIESESLVDRAVRSVMVDLERQQVAA